MITTRAWARAWVWAGLGVYGAALAGILFWPTPVDRPISGLLERALGKLHGWGLPQAIGYAQVEWLANVALFVPFGVLAALLLPRRSWWLAIPLALFSSAALELAQLLLPERFASVADITANTLGAALGALAARSAHPDRGDRRVTGNVQ